MTLSSQNNAMPADPKRVIQGIFLAKGKKGADQTAAAVALGDQKNKQKAQLYLIAAGILLLAYGVLFFYPNLSRYLQAGDTIRTLENRIADYENKKLPELEKTRLETKEQYESELHTAENIVSQIFPGTVDKVGITERLESFASLINSKTPPFEMDHLAFGDPIQTKEYTILPVSTSFSTSRANLDRFMKLIDLSGRFDGEYHVRLMEIQQIDIRYAGTDARTGQDKGVNVNVKLKAYSRPKSE